MANSLWNSASGLGERIAMLEQTVAQLKSVDVALHEIQQIIAGFAEKIQEGMVLIQGNKVIWVNLAGCRMFGYEPEELINTQPTSLVYPGYRKKLAERFSSIEAGGSQASAEIWPFIRKDHTEIYIRSFGYRVIYQGRPAIMSFYYDVTGERNLAQELTLRAQMLDAVSDAVFLLELNGDIVYVNRAACSQLGYEPDEITKMNIVNVNAPELQRRVGIRLKQVPEQKELVFKTVHVGKKGSRLPVVVRAKVIKWNERQYVLGVVNEVRHEVEDDI